MKGLKPSRKGSVRMKLKKKADYQKTKGKEEGEMQRVASKLGKRRTRNTKKSFARSRFVDLEPGSSGGGEWVRKIVVLNREVNSQAS